MRNPQTLPDSPATQPYNQGAKPMGMQQQPMGYPAPGGLQVATNPNNGLNTQPTQQPMLHSPEIASPTPNYQGQTNMSLESQPVTPTSLYGQGQGQGQGMNQNYGGQQPVTPPGQTNQSWQSAPANVSPDSHTGTSSPMSQSKPNSDEGFGDFFGGPPMGGAMGGSVSADLRGSPPPNHAPPPACPPPVAPNSSTDSQMQGVVQGMNAVTFRQEQSQSYQNYSIQPGQRQQNPYSGAGSAQHGPSFQPQRTPYDAADPWGVAPMQPWQQQQTLDQSQYQQQYQSAPSLGQPPQQQYQSYPGAWSGGVFSGRANQHQLPSLSHAAPPHQNPHCGAYHQHGSSATSGYGYENDQDDEEDESFNGKACADYKTSTDVMREYGAGLRALRLLDETTKNYVEDEDSPRTGGGLRQAVKHEKAKHKQAKQIRKLKRLEYKNKRSEMLAESSRTVNSVRKGYDPELTPDKCQLDFDRQREAQIKALKLMSSMF